MVLWTGEQLPRFELSYKQAGKWEEIGRKRLQGGDSHPRKESALFQGDNKNWEGTLFSTEANYCTLSVGKELYYSWLRPFDFLNKN